MIQNIYLKIICWLSLLIISQANAVTINFDGELLDRPCQIDSSSLEQTVIFLVRPVKDFQVFPGKGPMEKFQIKLINCDTNSIKKIVKLRFNGNTEPGMQDKSEYYLRVSGVNQGKLAIGLLDVDGTTPIKIGDFHNHMKGSVIENEKLVLDFKTFVQATNESINSRSVQPGEYSAVVNFELIYE